MRLEGRLSGPTKANHIMQALIKRLFESFQKSTAPLIDYLHATQCFLLSNWNLSYHIFICAFYTLSKFLSIFLVPFQVVSAFTSSLSCPSFGPIGLGEQKQLGLVSLEERKHLFPEIKELLFLY